MLLCLHLATFLQCCISTYLLQNNEYLRAMLFFDGSCCFSFSNFPADLWILSFLELLDFPWKSFNFGMEFVELWTFFKLSENCGKAKMWAKPENSLWRIHFEWWIQNLEFFTTSSYDFLQLWLQLFAREKSKFLMNVYICVSNFLLWDGDE